MKNVDVDVEANNPSSAHKSQSSEGCMLCTFLWTFLSIMLFIIFVAVPVANYENLHETTCNVTRVDYPTTLPAADYETDTDGGNHIKLISSAASTMFSTISTTTYGATTIATTDGGSNVS